jgi:hypothetical protein
MTPNKPIVGDWYRNGLDELFEVVAIDEEDDTIDVQYFDGTVTEMDREDWNEQWREGLLTGADPPEDWSGSVDIGAEDLNRGAEDQVKPTR